MKKSLIILVSLILVSISTACSSVQPTLVEATQSLPIPVIVTSLPNPMPTGTPTEQQPTMASVEDEQFDQQLGQAIETRSFDDLRSLMKDRFSIAVWDTELREIPTTEAIEVLQQFYLTETSSPVVNFETDVVTLLNGSDPLDLWGPITTPVRARHVIGIGPNADEEVVLVIAKDENTGKLYWHGMLVPFGGYFHTTSPQAIDVTDTDVHFVEALDAVNARTGPGIDYAVVGLVRSGEIAQVKGKSADGAWWLIYCTSDKSGFCWITADPSLTQPGTAP